MISFSLNQLKNTINSFNIFNISINLDKSKNDINLKENIIIEEKVKEPIKRDHKTTLSGLNLDLIENFNEDVIIYLFIQKQVDSSTWNLIAPIIRGIKTNKLIQFVLGYFGLQGSGGGMNSTDSLFYHSKKLKEKGYNVNIIPKVIENKLIHDFEYFDNNLTINDLHLKSIHLFNYSKGKHSSIKDEFNRLNQKYFA